MKLFYSLLFFFIASIGLISQEAPKKNTLLESIKQHNYQLLLKPYSIAIFLNFVDTPNRKYYKNSFLQQLKDRVDYAYNGLYLTKYYNSSKLATSFLTVKRSADIPIKFLSAMRQEMCIAIQISHYEKTIKIRHYSKITQRFSPLVSKKFKVLREISLIISDMIPKIASIEGIVVKHNKEYYVAFRGKAALVQKYIKNFFFVSRNNKKVIDSYVKIKELFLEKTFLCAKIMTLGEYRLHGIEKVHAIYFTAGKQKVKIIDRNRHPREGFSVYTSYSSFEHKKENYLLTTDLSGSFILQNQKKAPMYLSVLKNIDGVNFPIVQKHIILEDRNDILYITAEILEEIEPVVISLDADVFQVRNKVINRIIQAKNYIKEKDFKRGIIALKYAKKLVKNVRKHKKLKNALNVLDIVYKEALKQKEENTQKKACIKLMQIADKKVMRQQYKIALEKIKKAKKKWPIPVLKNKAYAEILKREKRLSNLLREEAMPIGRARVFLSKNIFSLQENEISLHEIQKIANHVANLLNDLQGQKIYSDRYILLKIRPFLDNFSNAFIEIANIHLEDYKSNENALGRRNAHENYEKYLNFSQKVDVILKELQKI